MENNSGKEIKSIGEILDDVSMIVYEGKEWFYANEIPAAVQAYHDQFTASKEKEYREALENIIKSWDEKTHEREQLKHFDGLDYWSPAASMVESKVIAAARKALNK